MTLPHSHKHTAYSSSAFKTQRIYCHNGIIQEYACKSHAIMQWTQVHAQNSNFPNSTQGNKLHWLQQLDMRQYISAHIETNNTDYGHTSTNHVRLPGLEGREIDSRLLGPDTLRLKKQIQLCSIHEQSIKITNEFSDYKNTVPAVVPLHNVNSFS